MYKWIFILENILISGGVNVVFEHALYALERGNSITIGSRKSGCQRAQGGIREQRDFIL